MDLDAVLNNAVELYQHFDKTVHPKVKETIFGKKPTANPASSSTPSGSGTPSTSPSIVKKV
jgi:hypothetical protein